MHRAALAGVLGLLLVARASAEDLSKVYKATLDWQEDAPAERKPGHRG